VVVCDTNTRRELTKSSYNGRAQDAHDTARMIGLVDRDVKTLRDVSLERLENFRQVLSENQYRRSHHVISEMERVQRGMDALRQSDLPAFGALMNDSYWSARDQYGSSSPALDAMWQAATRHPGCYGARYTGGGEAGAIVALVDVNAVDDFITHTSADYSQATQREGRLFPVEPAAGAGVFI
jgi:galactokinase